MADKIAKLLAGLSPKQLSLLRPVIAKIVANNLEGLDVTALKGHRGMYRVRVGNLRVVFTRLPDQPPMIILIAKRNEKTYKGL